MSRAEPASIPVRSMDARLLPDAQYWASRLAGLGAPVGLPVDAREPASLGVEEKARVAIDAPEDVGVALAGASGGRPAAAFACLLASLEICLARYTGATDIAIATPAFDDGTSDGADRLLLARDRVSPRQTLREVRRGVQQTLAEAYAHQRHPWTSILQLLTGDTDTVSSARPFRVGAGLDGFNQRTALDAAGAETIYWFQFAGHRLSVEVTFDAARWRADSIRIFVAHAMRALDALLTRPELRVSQVPLASAAEVHRTVHAWNDAPARVLPGPTDTVAALFRTQVACTPDATAVIGAHPHETLTYAELDRLADRLGARLRAAGVTRGDLVGVCLEHSPDLVAALLATWRAGAAYVPIDPTSPPSWQQALVSDARLGVIIARGPLESRDADAAPAAPTIIVPDADDGGTGGNCGTAGAARCRHNPAPGDLAYVMFTSGSTGRPKGVLIDHAALFNYVWWARQTYVHEARPVFPLYSAIGFDLTVTSLFTPLICGGTIVTHPPADAAPPILRAAADPRATHLKLTPSHLALLASGAAPADATGTLIVGGEALTTRLARQATARFGGDVRIWNEYGPTEATVGCMIHQFEPDADDREAVPIGRPAAGMRIYVLDDDWQPVPTLVPGEVYIGGVGLARGYLNRPDLTAERFLPDPFVPGARVYRSGDWARRLPDDALEYLGRRDGQIKFHGHRVELEAIRAALNRHPLVRDSAIGIRRDESGHDILLACYAADAAIPPAALRDFLAAHLRDAVVPNLFVHLRALPLSANGKVDRAALPTLAEARARLMPDAGAPRSPVEQGVAAIWNEILGIQTSGVHQDFFELGGHSLLATQVTSRLAARYHADLPLRLFFETPTIAALARHIEAARPDEHETGTPETATPALTAGPVLGDHPLSFVQQRLWFMDRLSPRNASYHITGPLLLRGALDLGALQHALTIVVRRHATLRTTFPAVDGVPVQRVAPAGGWHLPVLDLTALDDGPRARVGRAIVEAESQRPFDLAAAPAFRVAVVRLAADEHLLLFTLHHIVTDRWSMERLVDEVSRVYGATLAGLSTAWPDPPLQYSDFARWQADWLQTGPMQTQLAWWCDHLRGAPSHLDLPTDRARPLLQQYRGARLPVRLPAAQVSALDALCRREGVTMFMALLALLQALLSRYSGQEDIVIGSPIAGRHRPEFEPLLGCFVNTLALRTDLSGQPDFTTLLARVRDVCLDAYARPDLPFERIVDELRIARDLARHPIFQVMFVWQNTPAIALDTHGLQWTVYDVDAQTAKFDLTFDLEPEAGGIRGHVEYSTDLFDEETVRQLIERFETLLGHAVSAPDRPLAALPLQDARLATRRDAPTCVA